MTLPSGRSSLKRALLENYSALTEEKIGELATSKDNAIDKSIEALAEYKKILSSENEPKIILWQSRVMRKSRTFFML